MILNTHDRKIDTYAKVYLGVIGNYNIRSNILTIIKNNCKFDSIL